MAQLCQSLLLETDGPLFPSTPQLAIGLVSRGIVQLTRQALTEDWQCGFRKRLGRWWIDQGCQKCFSPRLLDLLHRIDDRANDGMLLQHIRLHGFTEQQLRIAAGLVALDIG